MHLINYFQSVSKCTQASLLGNLGCHIYYSRTKATYWLAEFNVSFGDEKYIQQWTSAPIQKAGNSISALPALRSALFCFRIDIFADWLRKGDFYEWPNLT